MKHENNGACLKCQEIIDRYPGIDVKLLAWFKDFQAKHPEAHTSCAGRGRQEQQDKFNHKLSNAQWGMSAHNFNCALDLFVLVNGNYSLDKTWFETVLEPNLADFLTWFGSPGSTYYERPHVQLKYWRDLKAEKLVFLVEDISYPGDVLND